MKIKDWYKQKENGLWMKIEIIYSLGGMNYFSGRNEPRGYSVAFTTFEKDKNFERYIPMSNENFRIFAKEVKRKSKKVERELVEYIDSIANELFKMYEKMNKEEIFNKIREFNRIYKQ